MIDDQGRIIHLDLGMDHPLRWIYHSSDPKLIIGAVIRHPAPENPKGYCEGSIWLEASRDQGKHDIWKMEGIFESPTFSPSIKCHCKKDHGHIIAGEWIPASS